VRARGLKSILPLRLAKGFSFAGKPLKSLSFRPTAASSNGRFPIGRLRFRLAFPSQNKRKPKTPLRFRPRIQKKARIFIAGSPVLPLVFLFLFPPLYPPSRRRRRLWSRSPGLPADLRRTLGTAVGYFSALRFFPQMLVPFPVYYLFLLGGLI
jgi:hypothetical protein